jgi:streptogramin lyase
MRTSVRWRRATGLVVGCVLAGARDEGTGRGDASDGTTAAGDGTVRPATELGSANRLVVVGNGTVWANDPVNGRLTGFDTSGKHFGQHLAAIGDFWVRLSVDDDGRLWVQRSPAVGDPGTTFDVHDSTGTRLAQLVIPYRAAAAGPALRARGRKLWIAVRDADDVVSVAHFRIDP